MQNTSVLISLYEPIYNVYSYIKYSCGLAVMIAWILSAHRVWSQCRLRVLTIAGEDMNSIFLEEQIQNLLRHLRIEVSVTQMTVSYHKNKGFIFYRKFLIIRQVFVYVKYLPQHMIIMQL